MERKVAQYGEFGTRAFCMDTKQNALFTLNENDEILTWDLWRARLRDVSSLPNGSAAQSILYADSWPLSSLTTSPANTFPSLVVSGTNSFLHTHHLYTT